MQNVFGILLLVLIIVLAIGLFKPNIVLRWFEPAKQTRGRVIMYVLPLAIAAFIGIGVTAKNDPEFQAAQTARKMQQEQLVASQKAEKDKLAREKEEKAALQQSVQNEVTVTALLDRATVDKDGNTKVGVLVKNNSEYRITKGTIDVILKDAAGHNIDSGSLSIALPLEPHGGAADVLWLNAKRSMTCVTMFYLKEFEKPSK